jgi:hypothetical protein
VVDFKMTVLPNSMFGDMEQKKTFRGFWHYAFAT